MEPPSPKKFKYDIPSYSFSSLSSVSGGLIKLWSLPLAALQLVFEQLKFNNLILLSYSCKHLHSVINTNPLFWELCFYSTLGIPNPYTSKPSSSTYLEENDRKNGKGWGLPNAEKIWFTRKACKDIALSLDHLHSMVFNFDNPLDYRNNPSYTTLHHSFIIPQYGHDVKIIPTSIWNTLVPIVTYNTTTWCRCSLDLQILGVHKIKADYPYPHPFFNYSARTRPFQLRLTLSDGVHKIRALYSTEIPSAGPLFDVGGFLRVTAIDFGEKYYREKYGFSIRILECAMLFSPREDIIGNPAKLNLFSLPLTPLSTKTPLTIFHVIQNNLAPFFPVENYQPHNVQYFTLIHMACLLGSSEIVKLIVNRAPHWLALVTPQGRNALHFCAMSPHDNGYKCAEIILSSPLMERNAFKLSSKTADLFGLIPYQIATEMGHFKTATVLKPSDFDTNLIFEEIENWEHELEKYYTVNSKKPLESLFELSKKVVHTKVLQELFSDILLYKNILLDYPPVIIQIVLKGLRPEDWNTVKILWESEDFTSFLDSDTILFSVKHMEQGLRKMFSNNFYAIPPLSGLISIYDNLHLFKHKPIDSYEQKVTQLLRAGCGVGIQNTNTNTNTTFHPIAGHSVCSNDQFVTNFDTFSHDMLEGMEMNNVLICGGSVVACLLPPPKDLSGSLEDYYQNSHFGTDIDVYIWGLDIPQYSEKLQHIYDTLCNQRHGDVLVYSTPNTIVFFSGFPYRDVQVVLGLWESPSHILSHSDIDCCGVGFNGKNVYATYRACQAFNNRWTVVSNAAHKVRGTPSYELRLYKYAKRGFRVVDPYLETETANSINYDHELSKIYENTSLLFGVEEDIRDGNEDYGGYVGGYGVYGGYEGYNENPENSGYVEVKLEDEDGMDLSPPIKLEFIEDLPPDSGFYYTNQDALCGAKLLLLADKFPDLVGTLFEAELKHRDPPNQIESRSMKAIQQRVNGSTNFFLVTNLQQHLQILKETLLFKKGSVLETPNKVPSFHRGL